jgi:prolyl-tRNA editing enzyme YbaK/EbsC (Cys-tRNA(Pro) deacylase)
MLFRNSDLAANTMAKSLHGTGGNVIKMLVFNSDSEEHISNDSDIECTYDLPVYCDESVTRVQELSPETGIHDRDIFVVQ